jgi:DNA-binding transcriptional LysR family regulator
VEIRHLRSIVAVGREQNFTRAARSLHIAQPALSNQIQASSASWGDLVARTNRTRLTDAGKALVARAERVLFEIENATNGMAAHAGVRSGVVRVDALCRRWWRATPKLLASFTPDPGIRIHFRGSIPVGARAMQRGEVDLGLIHLGRVDRTVVEQARRADSRWQGSAANPVLIVGPGHRLAQASAVRLDDLRNETFVGFRPGATVRKMVALAARRRGHARVGFATVNMGTVEGIVSAGLGWRSFPGARSSVPSPRSSALARGTSPRAHRHARPNTSRYETPAVAAVHRLLTTELRATVAQVD